MDTFFEQLITIKKTPKTWMLYIGISLAAILIMILTIMFLFEAIVIVVALVFYGIHKLYSLLNVEYEYIITNSSMDIDKIIAKSSRKRIMTFELTEVIRIEKYHNNLPEDIIKDAFFACNGDEKEAIVLVIQPEGKAKKYAVVAPDERMRGAMKKYIPKYVADNLD